MEPKTQSAGSLQPPGRVPPTAIGLATPAPPPKPHPSSYRNSGSRIGRWVVNLAPFPVLVMGVGLAAASPNEKLRIGGLLGFGVSMMVIGLFMGLGRYRSGEYIRGVRIPGDEPSRTELLRKRGRWGEDSGETAA
jgi:hypothetical protein